MTEDHTLVHRFNFPRREKTMRLELSIHGKWQELELPNPFYGTAFPVWTAEPFPQTIKDGEIVYNATGWTPGDFGWSLAGTVEFQGRPADYRIYVEEARDATGNEGNPMALPLGESAWKVKVTLTIGYREPLTPDRLVDFGTAKVPADGEYVILPVPPKMQEGQKTFVALVGKGAFAFRNGNYAPSEAPEPTPDAKYSIVTHREDKDGWRVRGNVVGPTFIMLELTGKDYSKFLSDSLALKCIAQDGMQSLSDSLSTHPTSQLRRTTIRD